MPENFLGFRIRVYTKDEIAYCQSKKNAVSHYAVRYSAKEATIKAVCSLGLSSIAYKDIEIINDSNRVPKIKIHDKRFENVEVIISLSHSKKQCIAFAISKFLKK